jgi:hypothetical protein
MGADRGVVYGDERVYAGKNPAPVPGPEPKIVYQPGTGEGAASAPGAPYANGAAPPPPMDGSAYQSRDGFESYERCLKDRGVAGGAIGAVVGAVIGNRVAGRGDRLAGSLIGGGLGALAGVGIEKATKKCRKYLPREDSYYYGHHGGHPGAYPPPHAYPSPGGYYQHGWYYPAPVVTTITITPAVTTTTTVTEEVYYETVPVKKKRSVRKWKPKPKPRCTCG